MKLIATITIWLLALLLAGLLILRLVRGRPTLVRSAIGRRAVRITALVLVFTGTSGLVGGKAAGQEQAEEQPDAEHDNRIGRIGLDARGFDIQQILDQLPDHYANARMGRTFGQSLGQAMAVQDQGESALAIGFTLRQLEWAQANTPHFYRIMRAQIAASNWPVPEGEPRAATVDWPTLLAASQEANDPQLFHPAVHLLLWRQTQQLTIKPGDHEAAESLRFVMKNLRRQIAAHEAITGALAILEIAPMRVDQRAWMSKAGPRPGRDHDLLTQRMREVWNLARMKYSTGSVGIWESEGQVELFAALENQNTVLCVGQERSLFTTWAISHFGRLDLIETQNETTIIVSRWLGEIKLPANTTLRASDLPPLLSDEARAKVAEAIQAVLDRPQPVFDDDIVDPEEAAAQEAAVQLERHLPLVAPMLAEAIREQPEAYGTATLRTLLHQYQLPAEAADSARQLRGFERERLGPELDGF